MRALVDFERVLNLVLVQHVGEGLLRNAVCEFLAHYHVERNHQGLHNRLIQPGLEVGKDQGEIACRSRMGGMLQYYYRKAARFSR